MSLKFKLIGIRYQDASKDDDGDSDFLLEMDNWNDFGFETTYHLHASKKITKNQTRYLGYLNIMKIGQSKSEPQLLYGLYKDEKQFSSLPKDYVSFCFSLDLYRAITQLLPEKNQRLEFIKSLNLIFDINDSKYKDLINDECFTTSILRGASLSDFSIIKGKQLLLDEATYYSLEENTIKIQLENSITPIEISFNSNIQQNEQSANLPYGIVALIGHNGCGKSTFMYELAKVLYMDQKTRADYKNMKLYPSDIGITKVIFSSFSIFDNFLFPGNNLPDYKLMAEGINNNDGRFVYCGIRNIKSELVEIEKVLRDAKIEQEDKPEEEKLSDEQIFNNVYMNSGRVKNIVLKSNDDLRDDFNKALYKITDDKEKRKRWNQMINRSSILLPSVYNDIRFFNYDCNIHDFNRLSTGIKYFIITMAYVFAYTEDNSLLLFDEIETFLHPPLISFMLNEIKQEIRYTHSVVLITTHTPVVIQELFSKNVYIINRDDNNISFRHPEIEVYGENFGDINNLVFGLNSDISNYHQRFDDLYESWNCNKMDNIDSIINTFKKNLNCDFLSTQMISYLANKFYIKENK